MYKICLELISVTNICQSDACVPGLVSHSEEIAAEFVFVFIIKSIPVIVSKL